MRIGLISSPWFAVPPTAYGGIERVVDTLARGFAAAGEDVLLAAPSDSSCPVPLAPGMRETDSQDLGMSGSEMNHVIRAYEALRGVDVIHDHTLIGPLYAHRPPGVPVATTIHGRLLPEIAEIYRAMSRDTRILGISHDQVHEHPELNVARVIHHGMDLSEVPVGTGKGGYACFVGRMSPDKGALEAVRIAQAAGLPLRLAAKVSEPAELEYFHDVVEPVLGPDDEFVGEIGGPEKYHLMGDAFALLNPIQWPEPFGLVMIEALAAGTPVVATPSGSAPEIVDSGITGYLAPAEELSALLPKAAGLDRAECRRAVSERFSAERMVADHLDFYRELLARRA
ncbi:MAG: glycosyltransferase family 4 protein [Pseudarthrobacter sp.]|nr:glycosyltransferase family 4 protein [Pseudarthrobacter sp.]